ncbi:MAG: ParB/RepB/Spo0J family partition protein [Alphaproteobacteria bacterium]|nr:ParB/RepB/Spo0J family partition protein [Alphaproteobacteria bacterium]
MKPKSAAHLSSSSQVPAGHIIGPKPELKWVKLAELFIDQEYQRSAKTDRSRANIAHIQLNFSWAAFGALIVAFMPKKKQYAVIDGQHRFLAAQSVPGITEVPCVVISDHDFKKQAKSFVAINTKRVNLHTLGKYHAAVAAGDETAVAIAGLLNECKIEVPKTPVLKGDTDARQLQAIGTLQRMIDRYSQKQLVWALTIIPEAYGEERGQMRSSMIKALAEFIKQHPDAERKRMLAVLRDIDPDQLEEDSRAAARMSGKKSTAVFLEALERLYKNAGRKGAAA